MIHEHLNEIQSERLRIWDRYMGAIKESLP